MDKIKYKTLFMIMQTNVVNVFDIRKNGIDYKDVTIELLSKIYSKKKIEIINDYISNNNFDDIRDNYLKNNIKITEFASSDYPKELFNLFDFPPYIYSIGDYNLLNKKKTSIVGSRNPSNYSLKLCEKVVSFEKNVIVSGLAKGIDAFAHRNAIYNEIRTIGVLGFGLDQIYPKSNKDLFNYMCESELLITEFALGIKITKDMFARRNRLIALLCDKLIVIQAADKSGSLLTANIAIEYGIDIYVPPSIAFDKSYEGSHKLIYEGAKILYFNF